MTSARSALAVIEQVAAQQGGIDFEAASLVEFPLARDLCKRLQVQLQQQLRNCCFCMCNFVLGFV